MAKITIAQALQSDVDTSLAKELKEYDGVAQEFGDAFLMQLADTVTHLMRKRATLKPLATKMDGVLSYYKQLYPKDFAAGMVEDFSGKNPTSKKPKKM